MKKILCIVAHPDDEALGPGGSLIKHNNRGDDVNIFIFSDGEGAKTLSKYKDPNRIQVAKKWSKQTNSKIYKIANYPDQKLDSFPQLDIVKEIEIAIKKIRPNIVYIHNPSDINKDHQTLADACLVALRPMKFLNTLPEIRAFETPSSTDQAPKLAKYSFNPNLYISVVDEWEAKIKALKLYHNELGDFPHPRSLKNLEALAIKRGAESGLKMAEAFMIIKKIVL